jgi:hypothetical protein
VDVWKLRWLLITPLGLPVVPPVGEIATMSSIAVRTSGGSAG